LIYKMINNANDKCFKCYSEDHYCKYCPYEKLNNFDMIILKYKIIKSCQKYDIGLNEIININDLLKVLIEVNKDIFKGITHSNIYGWCQKINKNNIKGINKINFKSCYINYKDFIIGMFTLLDKIKF